MADMPDVAALINFDADPRIDGYFRLNDTPYGMLDDNPLAAGDVWSDVTAWLVSCTFSRGSGVNTADPVTRYEAGTGTALLRNDDRRFDPTNLAGPYVTPLGVSQIQPLRLFWWRATWAGVTYDLGQGFIDWSFDYAGPVSATAQVNVTDAFSILSMPQAVTVAQGAGELTGARVARILDVAQWSTADRVIGTGGITVQATTFGQNALQDLQDVNDTELGELYIDGAGNVVFRDRFALLTEDRSVTSQAIFGSDVANGELPYVDVGIVFTRPKATTVRATRIGGTQQSASVAAKYPIAWERDNLLMETDQAAAGWARRVLGTAKDPRLRFSSLTVDPRANPDALFPQVLGRQIGDRITVRRRPPGGGSMIESDCFIRGITHEYSSGHWVTTWALETAVNVEFLILDDPVSGRLNDYRLSYP